MRKYIPAIFNFLCRRQQNVKLTFAPPYAKEVLAELAVFCRANESCYHDDPRLHAVLEGRREVWLWLQNHLNLSPEQVYSLYNNRDTPQEHSA